METPLTTEMIVFGLVVSTAVGGVFWRVWNKLTATVDDLAAFKLTVSKEYVNHDTFRRVEERFENLGDRLLARMDKLDASMNRLTGRFDTHPNGE